MTDDYKQGPPTAKQKAFLEKNNQWTEHLTYHEASKLIGEIINAKNVIKDKSPYPQNSKQSGVTSFHKGRDNSKSIERQCCLKAAVEFTNHLDMELRTPENVVSTAETFRKWVQNE